VRLWVAGLAFVASVQTASALSCLPPDIRRMYQEAAGSAEVYFLVEGRVSHSGGMPIGNHDIDALPPEMTEVAGTFDGVAYGWSRDVAFEADITLEVACLAGWCGGLESGTDVLGFLRKTESGYALSVGPCGGLTMAGVTEEMRAQARSCLEGGLCEPEF